MTLKVHVLCLTKSSDTFDNEMPTAMSHCRSIRATLYNTLHISLGTSESWFPVPYTCCRSDSPRRYM